MTGIWESPFRQLFDGFLGARNVENRLFSMVLALFLDVFSDFIYGMLFEKTQLSL